MRTPARIVHELGITARLAGRVIGRRLRGELAPPPDDAVFRATHEPWLGSLPPRLLAARAFHYLPATRPPWFNTGIELLAGDEVTLLAEGRVYLSRLLDIWAPPSFRLWCRVGDDGPVFRGTRNTHSFTAGRGGRLWLASYYPGMWADPQGRLATPVEQYASVSGGMSVLLLKWQRGVQADEIVRRLAGTPGAPALVQAEAARLDAPSACPEHWQYLWFVGPGEIYRPTATEDGRAAILCHTHGDAAILHRDAGMPLVPGAALRWSWRVERLPMDLAEDTLPSHDYMSIAVEFDDGQDITYYWSSSLPVGTVYRCPLPNWNERETHVVVRSGRAGLGRWFDEERDLHADYRRIIGGPARRISRVWLIAVSQLYRGHGRCEYASIELNAEGRRLELI
jgi:hypothetical protein